MEEVTFFHGSSSAVKLGHMLLPPSITGVIQEEGRRRNLSRVFMTRDIGSARIYAGRAVARFGGSPVVYRVIPMGRVETLHENKGSSVYMTEWAFVEEL